MGFFTRLATKSMCATIRKSLPNASVERLTQHYNKLIEVRREVADRDDWQLQVMVHELSQEVANELQRRGIETPWANAS